MKKRNTVYSTDSGRHCPDCGEPASQCRCNQQAAPGAADGIVRLQRQVKGRNGKPVVIVDGIPGTPADLKDIAKKLKSRCAVGGTVEDQRIVIQGDKREQIRTELEKLGFTVKLSGG